MALNKISSEVVEINIDNYIESAFKTGNSLSDLGWSSYVDSAGVNPVDGLGGSPNITTSLNTSSPLSGDADLRIVKDAVNRQGQGIGYNFTIENRHLAKVLQIAFDMELISGTYASGDLRVSIIQDPTGTPVVLEPVGTALELGIANQKIREIATFQTHVSVTSYRLCIHVSSTSASAYTVDFANFKVWEPTQSVGALITDWQSYTPTIQGGGTLTNVSVRWRRIGGSVEIQGKLTLGTVSSDEFQLSLPNGITVSPIVSTTNHRVGQINYTRPSGDPYGVQFVLLASSSHSYLGHSGYYQNQLDGRSQGDQLTRRNTNYLLETGGTISFQAEVPIAGWGSSVAMSSDTGDGRVVAVTYSNPANATASNTTPVRYTNLINDTHNSYNTTTGKFIAPLSGYYSISASYTHGAANNSQVYVDNSATAYIILAGDNSSGGGSTVIYLNAGQSIDIRPDQSSTVVTSQSTRRFSVFRISAGSQIIATQETVSASYYSAATQTSLTAQINFGARLYDTHGAVTTGVGTWKFTAPMSGKYLVSGFAETNSSTGINLYKNGSLLHTYITYALSGNGVISFVIDLLAGEYFDLRPNSSVDAQGGTRTSGNAAHIQITRIGN